MLVYSSSVLHFISQNFGFWQIIPSSRNCEMESIHYWRRERHSCGHLFLRKSESHERRRWRRSLRKSRGDAMNCFCNIGVSCLEPHRSIHLPNKTLFRSMVLLQTPKNHLRKRPFSVTAPCAFYMNPWEFSTLLGCLVYEGVSHPTHSHFVGRWLVLQPHHLRQVTVVLPVFQRSVPEWLGSWHGWSWLVHGFYKRGPLGSL